MDTNINTIDEEIQNLTVEQLADLKVEAEDILFEIKNLLAECDKVLNS